ncbi:MULTISPECIES: alpha/beta fold hydrolase [unclassified Thalassospira]|uniref:alpha/beta fold hydrolase n=1 Tax=unclassified Thalassospira TaxID=2648997 RepID=UPI0007A5B9EA|nr:MULTISPECIES: alpha/beta fold hydrolase [unclassified Thalassospira]KZD02314.1 hypothetical protein AUQ41_02420 [Thalassospira sp. MCCC 1A02898]
MAVLRDLVFIHSAGPQGGNSGSTGLISRLEEALGDEFHIIAPLMPDPERPDIDGWLAEIAKTVSQARSGAVLMGHSLGGSSILQYLARNPQIWRDNNRFAAVFSIAAPFWGLEDWEVTDFSLTEDELAILEGCRPMHFCHSKDDKIVGFAHCETYLQHFPQADQITLNDAGHALSDGDITALIQKIRIYA